MAATFRSHFRNPTRQDDNNPTQTLRKQSSRIPTSKPSSSNTQNKQSKAAQHVSKLAKRASRSITPLDQTEHSTKSTARPPAPMTAAQNVPAASKKASVTPRAEEYPPGVPAPSASRHNGALPPPPTLRTPSLVSGSSASTFDSPRSNGLRRKPSTIGNYAESKRGETPTIEADGTTMHRRNEEYNETFEHSVLGISLPTTGPYQSNAAISAPIVEDSFEPELYYADRHVTKDITPPLPNYAPSATPSTRYSDSPFSHVPTPSSASSYSPAVVLTTGGGTPGLRQQSPTRSRPLATSRATDKSRLGLPPVRESSTSSSNSTVKPAESRPSVPRKDVPRKPGTASPTSKAPDTSRPKSRGKLVKEKPKQASNPSIQRPPVQIPPELAHLNVDPPSKPSLNKALPPIRPSRDGTPVLTGVRDPSPVVQSDLPNLYTTYHKRTPSQETPASPMSPTFKTRFGLSSRGSSTQASPRIDSAISPPPAARTFARGPTPDLAPSDKHRLTRKDSPAVGTAPSPSKSPRFGGIFSRKPKSDATKATEKPKRQPTKGPAAGTGHEGYGRFGYRGRSGSTTSSDGVRSPSVESSSSSKPARPNSGRKSSVTSKDGSDLDDFLRERQNPIILRGSGSTISNTASSSDVPIPNAPESSNTSSLDLYTKPQLLPSAMHRTTGTSPSKRGIQAAPSESSEDDATTRLSTLAARRSINRLSQVDGKPSVARLPAPLNTSIPPKKISLNSYGVEGSEYPQTDRTLPTEDTYEAKEGLWLQSQKPEPEPKPPRNWNFFQRAQASPRTKGKGKAVVQGQVPSSVHQSPYRGVGHYAMMDPVEPVDLEEVEKIMQENSTSPEDSMSESNLPPKIVPYESRHKSLLPSPPKNEYSSDSKFRARPPLPRIMVRQDSPEPPHLMRAQTAVPQPSPQMVSIPRSPIIPGPDIEAIVPSQSWHQMPAFRQTVHTPEMNQAPVNAPGDQENNQSPRQPRLSPVGRIPKVVSKRDRDRKLSDSSFSRPFARAQPRPSVKPPGSLYTQIRELASPIESGSQPVSSSSTRSDGASGEPKSSVNTDPSVSTNRTSMDLHANSEFFSFPPRKDSDFSQSSSSGNNSWMAALSMQPQEEDVWNEYNDFVDEVMQQRTPRSTASSLGAPFQYSSALYEPPNRDIPEPLNWSQPPPLNLPAPPRSQTVPAVLSVPQQIARFMQPSMSPLTPHSLSDFVDHYGNRSTSTLFTSNRTSLPGPKQSSIPQPNRSSSSAPNRSSLPQANRSSLPSNRASVASSRYSRGSAHSRSASLPEANARNSQSSLTPSMRFNRDTQLLDIAEVDGDDQAAAANLRFGALMTSKWLSFGRVLFSPAHNEMRLADEPRVLIIDGLGSDWSYYLALSYPSATVYNLGPTPVNGFSDWPGVTQQPPPNHRHINLSASSSGFPFPKGFFTAVVFRFPIATTDQTYYDYIFECKRVLRPGGYLEVAVLDLDLMNMGNKARKAVRGLKTRMQQSDCNISLRNLSDTLVSLIGRRGFEEIQRCIVGVPAAGHIPRSQDISSHSSSASGKRVWQREDRDSQEFSFADLLEDARVSQVASGRNNDEGITKMVAKVGRWWYSTCYEKALLQSDNSIWNDHTLLRECEKQGTSFRLLICYAQKPTQTRRRTVSV